MPLPPTRGMYDPSLERDACGLGFVADLRRPATHDVVEKGVEILRRLAHRGAAGCDPCTSDGAGILLHIPHAHYERVLGRSGVELPNTGDYAVAQCFLSRESRARAAEVRCLEDAVRHHNQEGDRLARRPGRHEGPGPARAVVDARAPAALHRAHVPCPRVRADPLHDPQACELPRDRRRPRRLLCREPVVADCRLQGAVPSRAPRRLLSRSSRGGDEEQVRARPLALQHQHVPDLGARAPVPADRPQRGDQHPARQPDVDGRARGAPPERGVRRAPRGLQADHPPRRERLGFARQRRRLSRRRGSQPAARDDDARPRSVGRAARDARGEARLLRVPRVARRAVGRACGAPLHRRRLSRRDARPQRASADEVRRHGQRLRRRGERARRRRLRARGRHREGAPAAGTHAARRSRPWPSRRGRGDQARDRGPQAVRAVARGQQDRPPRAPGRLGATAALDAPVDRRQAAGAARVRVHPRRRARAARAHGRERRGAHGEHGDRRPAGGAQRPTAGPVSVFQAAVRAGHQSAHRPDPREARHDARRAASAARGTCSQRRPASVGCSSSSSRC